MCKFFLVILLLFLQLQIILTEEGFVFLDQTYTKKLKHVREYANSYVTEESCIENCKFNKDAYMGYKCIGVWIDPKSDNGVINYNNPKCRRLTNEPNRNLDIEKSLGKFYLKTEEILNSSKNKEKEKIENLCFTKPEKKIMHDLNVCRCKSMNSKESLKKYLPVRKANSTKRPLCKLPKDKKNPKEDVLLFVATTKLCFWRRLNLIPKEKFLPVDFKVYRELFNRFQIDCKVREQVQKAIDTCIKFKTEDQKTMCVGDQVAAICNDSTAIGGPRPPQDFPDVLTQKGPCFTKPEKQVMQDLNKCRCESMRSRKSLEKYLPVRDPNSKTKPLCKLPKDKEVPKTVTTLFNALTKLCFWRRLKLIPEKETLPVDFKVFRELFNRFQIDCKVKNEVQTAIDTCVANHEDEQKKTVCVSEKVNSICTDAAAIGGTRPPGEVKSKD